MLSCDEDYGQVSYEISGPIAALTANAAWLRDSGIFALVGLMSGRPMS